MERIFLASIDDDRFLFGGGFIFHLCSERCSLQSLCLVVCGGGGFLVAVDSVYPAYLTKGVCGFLIDLVSLYSNTSQFGD